MATETAAVETLDIAVWLGITDLGQGAAGYFYYGDVNGDGIDEIVQRFGSDHLGLIVYGSDVKHATGFKAQWGQEDMGQGVGGAFLIGRFHDSGRCEIVQAFGPSGLTFIRYGNTTDGGAIPTDVPADVAARYSLSVLNVSDLSPAHFSDENVWIVGDVDGDGKDEVVQLFGSDHLGVALFGDDGQGGFRALPGCTLDAGLPGGGMFTVADVDGDGRDEIVQLWKNGVVTVLKYVSGALTRLAQCNIGITEEQNYVAFMAGRFQDKSCDSLVVALGNDGLVLVTIVGASSGGGFSLTSKNNSMGQGTYAKTWLTADLENDGYDEIVQPFNKGAKNLGMLVYGRDGDEGMKVVFGSPDMNEGNNAVAWGVGTFFDKSKTKTPTFIFQGWSNDDDKLGAIFYASIAPTGNAKTTSEKLQLLTDYAPKIWLAKEEAFFPSSVEWAFENTTRILGADGNYSLTTTTPLSGPQATLPYFSGQPGSLPNGVPIYAFWVDKDPFVDLIYFTFYPYNLGKHVGGSARYDNHVGDWEHVTLRMLWVEDAGVWDLIPHTLATSAHDTGTVNRWADMAKIGGTHPIVYAGDGSHGLWPTAGKHPYKDIVVAVLKDYCSEGTAWDTWNDVVPFDYATQTNLSTGDAWPNWLSKAFSVAGPDPSNPASAAIYRWGNPAQGTKMFGQYPLEIGPEGPISKKLWSRDQFG